MACRTRGSVKGGFWTFISMKKLRVPLTTRSSRLGSASMAPI